MKSFYLAFCLFFALVNCADQNTPLCNVFGKDANDNSQPISIGLNGVTVFQGACVKYFQLDLQNDLFRNKYLTIEVRFTKLPNHLGSSPMLAGKIGEMPVLYYNLLNKSNFQANDVVIDYNAYINQLMYASIVLTPQNTTQGNFAYFAVYGLDANYSLVNIQYEYEITVTPSDEFPCPQSCSNRGFCDQDQKKCLCSPGSFGSDCSVSATLLSESFSQSHIIPFNEFAYYYIPQNEFSNDFLLHVEKEKSSTLYMFVLLNGPGTYDLVNFENTQETVPLMGYQYIDLPLLNGTVPQNNGQILIGMYNPKREAASVGARIVNFSTMTPSDSTKDDTRPITGGVGPIIVTSGPAPSISTASSPPMIEPSNDDDDDHSTLRVFVIILVVVIVVKVILLIIITLRKGFQRGGPAGSAPPAAVVVVAEADADRQEPQQPARLLTLEEFEKYFPKKNYAEIRGPFTQNTCSICLDDFDENSECHQLYCKHVFHGDCIKTWLETKHETCPNCMKSMSRDAIEGFLRSGEQEGAGGNVDHIDNVDRKEDDEESVILRIDGTGPYKLEPVSKKSNPLKNTQKKEI